METSQRPSIEERINCVESSNGILFCNKKERRVDVCYSSDEPWKRVDEKCQSQKNTPCMSAFMQNAWNRQIHMDRKQISGCLELRGKAMEGGRRMPANVHKASLWSEDSVLKLIVVMAA